MLPWKTIIHIDRASSKAVYLQIVNAIIREISQGRLQSGQRLPGTRKLAELLCINRKTAIIAYEELMAQGWIEIASSSGTFVADHLSIKRVEKLPTPFVRTEIPPPTAILPGYFSEVELYKTPPPHHLQLNDGIPDVRLVPMNNLLKYYRAAINSFVGRKLLGYGDVQGQIKLREVLAQYLHQTRGLNCNADQIMITRGSNMAIFLSFYTLLQVGDKVVVTSPNYRSANWAVLATRGQLVTVGVDESGIKVEEVAAICKKEKIRAVYVTPHHHYPTTVTLSAERRMQLLVLAEQYDFVILEDDYDYSFRYDSAPILPLASVDNRGHVFYIGSLSKLLAPAIRVGYLVAPAQVIAQMTKIRRLIDRQGDLPMEYALAQFIQDGELQRHLKKVVKIYHKRRDLFCQLLEAHLADFLQFKKPEGGMSIWGQFLQPINYQSLIEACLRHGLYLNVAHEFLESHGGLRLGFASLNEKEMEEVIEILAKCLVK